MLGYHLVLRLGDDRVIAPSRAERRRVARKLAELSRTFGVVAWKLADTHLHVLLVGDEAAAAELVRRLRIWFTNALRPGVPLELQRRKPVAAQSHLEAAFRYVLRQDDHHGLETDALQEASSLPDTLGLRVLCPEIALRVKERLPRTKRDMLLVPLGVAALEEEVHVEHLAEAAAAAYALEALPLRGDGARARAAAAVAARRDVGTGAIARALGITVPAASRLAARDAPARDVRAVRLQMALRAARPPAPARTPEDPGDPWR